MLRATHLNPIGPLIPWSIGPSGRRAEPFGYSPLSFMISLGAAWGIINICGPPESSATTATAPTPSSPRFRHADACRNRGARDHHIRSVPSLGSLSWEVWFVKYKTAKYEKYENLKIWKKCKSKFRKSCFGSFGSLRLSKSSPAWNFVVVSQEQIDFGHFCKKLLIYFDLLLYIFDI